MGKVVAGKYKILDRLGSGAMGSIYKAEHTALSKPVVIKVLHRHLIADQNHIKRFHREAKAASRLNHPNCISVLDFGQTEDGWLYICMEYVAGKDLCRIIFEEKRLEPRRVIHIASQVLDALDEAHAQGVIHRDLKPENIMIERLRTNPDFVKVLDFGIAKIRDVDGRGDTSGFKTATGMVFGTPEYMSPEQIRGEELDGRSDLYSLGIVMYHMLTGELPFTGDSVLEIATKHLREPPVPLSEKRPDLPRGLCAFVHKLLEKDREKRFRSAAEARAALEQVSWDGGAGAGGRVEEGVYGKGSAIPEVREVGRQEARGASNGLQGAGDERADTKEALQTVKGKARVIRNLAIVVMVLLGAAAITFLAVTLLQR